MVTLANVRGRSLTPDLSGGLNAVAQIFQEREAQKQQEAFQADIDIALGGEGIVADRERAPVPIDPVTGRDITGIVPEPRRGRAEDQALSRILRTQGPQALKGITDILDRREATELKESQRVNLKSLRRGTFLKGIKDPVERQREITRLVQEDIANGEDPAKLTELAQLSPERQLLKLDEKIINAGDSKFLLDRAVKKAEAAQESFTPVLDAQGNIVAQRSSTTGKVVSDPRAKPTGGQQGRFAKAPGVIVELEGGGFAQSIPVLNERTGQIENKVVPIAGQPVSRLGETAGETTARKIEEAGGRELAKGASKRIGVDIDDGLAAAEGLGQLHRAIQLLEDVETGGIDLLRLKASQFFGVEEADDAELSATLGRAVLAQIRPLFGAQPSEQEGARLAAIEAGFGKSTAGNIRLLKQTINLAKREAKRGIAAAVEAEDFRTAQDIQDLVDFRFPSSFDETTTGDGTLGAGAVPGVVDVGGTSPGKTDDELTNRLGL